MLAGCYWPSNSKLIRKKRGKKPRSPGDPQQDSAKISLRRRGNSSEALRETKLYILSVVICGASQGKRKNDTQWAPKSRGPPLLLDELTSGNNARAVKQSRKQTR